MWASTYREDRYVKELGGWIGTGRLSDNSLKNVCNEGQLIRDLSLISAAKELLEKWEVQYEFASPVIITADMQSPVMALYSDVLAICKDNLLNTRIATVELANCWDLWHANSISTKRFYWKNFYKDMAGTDWPDFENFITNNYTCSKYIQQELRLFVEQFSNTIEHPTPPEYLQYLDNIFPILTISDSTRTWVHNLSRELDPQDELAYYTSNIPTRFNLNQLSS